MTVVFDSGVLISALHFGGTPLAALSAASDHASLAHCNEIDNEVRKALAGKFKWHPANIEQAMRIVTGAAQLIEISGNLIGVCRDPKDDMVLECALQAAAQYIVSGDRDLLVLGEYAGIAIVTPRSFLNIVGEE